MHSSSVPYGSPKFSDQNEQIFDLPWLRQFATQNQQLDGEHLSVLRQLNKLLHALNSSDRHAITMACTAMSVEARAHFVNENKLMSGSGYPDIEEHIEQHEDLLRRLDRIRFRLISGVGFWSPTNERRMLEQWFVSHLTDDDQRFSEFIVARSETGQTH
jgi:hemerythrin